MRQSLFPTLRLSVIGYYPEEPKKLLFSTKIVLYWRKNYGYDVKEVEDDVFSNPTDPAKPIKVDVDFKVEWMKMTLAKWSFKGLDYQRDFDDKDWAKTFYEKQWKTEFNSKSWSASTSKSFKYSVKIGNWKTDSETEWPFDNDSFFEKMG